MKRDELRERRERAEKHVRRVYDLLLLEIAPLLEREADTEKKLGGKSAFLREDRKTKIARQTKAVFMRRQKSLNNVNKMQVSVAGELKMIRKKYELGFFGDDEEGMEELKRIDDAERMKAAMKRAEEQTKKNAAKHGDGADAVSATHLLAAGAKGSRRMSANSAFAGNASEEEEEGLAGGARGARRGGPSANGNSDSDASDLEEDVGKSLREQIKQHEVVMEWYMK